VRHGKVRLADDLRRLGVAGSDLVMVHASMRAIGPVVGGAETMVRALQDAVGPSGTLMAYVDFEPFVLDGDDPGDIPAFDPRTARAALDHGILHEVLRTWPGSMRSAHPDAGVVAIGPLAQWLVDPHPFQYGYGEGTPFARFVERQGKVLMLGAPLDTLTILHHAEHLARIPGKRVVRYRRRMHGRHGTEWVEFEEFDTSEPVNDRLPPDCFDRIARGFLDTGGGRSGLVGEGPSYLFPAAELVRFGIAWLEQAVPA
jgi:aminoglycoside 3-N-acetyltransferase